MRVLKISDIFYILYSFPGPPLSDMARLAQDVTGIPSTLEPSILGL